METGLKDKTILITGASGGIGIAAAEGFAAEGARLVLHCHRQEDALEGFSAGVKVPTMTIAADLRDEQLVDAMVAEAVKTFGQLDGIVVCAGIWNEQHKPVHEMKLEQWNETIATDLTSAFLTCRAFMRHLEKAPRPKASIVLVGSTAALYGEAGHVDYAAAKAGMVYGLTLSLKNEIVRLAPHGRVNCVCPGWTDTPMTAKYTKNKLAVDAATSTMSLRKIATPQDVACAIVYLSSDKLAGHLSGTIVPVAGGMEGRLLHPL